MCPVLLIGSHSVIPSTIPKIIDLIMDIIAKFELNIINIEISKNKICIRFKDQFNLVFMESLHNKLFNIY